jgi:integrase
MKRKKLVISESSTVRQACEFYFNTPAYLSVSGQSQKDYYAAMIHACNTPIQNNKLFGNVKLKHVKFKHATYLYDTWLADKGVRRSNYHATCMSIVFNTAIRHEAMVSNPMSLIKRSKPHARKVKWSEQQVKLFLDTAFSQYRWRSIGLIFHMSYEWGQRLGDMRNLQWSNINFEDKKLDLEQSKRRADVHLPIGDDLLKQLQVQHSDFHTLSDCVAPRVYPRNGKYSTYKMAEISGLVNEVKEESGLPKELWGMDLRRTAITEMVEAGVDITGIMQVSGHNSPQSVMPYLVNTFSGASTALNKRKANKK